MGKILRGDSTRPNKHFVSKNAWSKTKRKKVKGRQKLCSYTGQKHTMND